MRQSLAFAFLFGLTTTAAVVAACGGSSPGQNGGGGAADGHGPPPPAAAKNEMNVSRAREILARFDNRPTKPCSIHCDGGGHAVRLQLEAGQDYRFLLMTKSVGTRDELHISNVDRNTNVMLVENSDVGEILSVSGEGALKVCSKFQMADRGCDWTCSVDLAAGVVTVATKELSAEFAIVCY